MDQMQDAAIIKRLVRLQIIEQRLFFLLVQPRTEQAVLQSLHQELWIFALLARDNSIHRNGMPRRQRAGFHPCLGAFRHPTEWIFTKDKIRGKVISVQQIIRRDPAQAAFPAFYVWWREQVLA